jgi:hypothetical protein
VLYLDCHHVRRLNLSALAEQDFPDVTLRFLL